MSSGSINGVPVRDHRAAVLAQQASTVLAMAAEDHPARDSLRRAASECLERARLLLVGEAERDAGTAYMVEGPVGVTEARRIVGRHLLRLLLRALQDQDFAEPPRAGLEADDGPDRGVHAYRVTVMDGLKQLIADGQLRLELGGAELKIDRFINDRDGDDLHDDSSVSRGPESPDETTVEASGCRGEDSGRGAQGDGAPLSPEALDALAIILTEATYLVDEPGYAVPNRVATIRHAASTLDQILGNDMACPFITHHNGQLCDSYLSARASLEDGA